ncbi:ABC transporter permease [Salisediminibacterium selenitireducens]|uniref:Transport permease protein n=1 Tax=Bacillus selenitireducens (strain ATCC 700615 / DSM 15326 / MLS10) TaxID=439292 RepID=D6Y1I2_BACIE|nr:ABC transporter permease [Salisediminibacterium selenitireducens]ADI00769.1 ABC-2 type transporter [[Bacillus] selenitireducens MLS10]
MEGIIAIWQRDLMKFFRDKARLFGSFTMPILFLLIFGGGMSGTMETMMMGNMPDGTASFNYVEFVFPGIVAMTLLMTSVFSAMSVIEDKDKGYMKEILVSPISRVSIAIGKMLGAATVATIQGIILFLLIPFLGLSYGIMNLLQVIPFMFLFGAALSGLGLLFASIIRSTQGFQMTVQILVMPMIFLSGALFPVSNMPAWMDVIVKINPVTYGVDVMKKLMIDTSELSPVVIEAMGLNIEVFGRQVTIFEEILFIAAFAAVLVFFATISFKRANA